MPEEKPAARDPFGQTVWAGKHYHVKFQNGSPKEYGVNGCKVEDLLDVILRRLKKVNEAQPCMENTKAMIGVEAAMQALNDKAERLEKAV